MIVRALLALVDARQQPTMVLQGPALVGSVSACRRVGVSACRRVGVVPTHGHRQATASAAAGFGFVALDVGQQRPQPWQSALQFEHVRFGDPVDVAKVEVLELRRGEE